MPTPPPLQPGDCPACGKFYKNLPPHVNAHRRKGEAVPSPGDLAGAEGAGPFGEVSADAATSPLEPAPVEPKVGWREKLWGAKDGPKPSQEPKPKAPGTQRPRRRREPLDGLLGGVWGVGGMGLERSGADIPVGRVMQFQQPIAGPILDELVADTSVDRLLQKVGGNTEKWEQAAALFALPLAVAVCERSPELATALQPLALAAIRKNLAALGPAMKKAQEEEARYREAAAEMGIPSDADPALAVWQAIFEPPPPAPPPEANGQAADAEAAAAAHGAG